MKHLNCADGALQTNGVPLGVTHLNSNVASKPDVVLLTAASFRRLSRVPVLAPSQLGMRARARARQDKGGRVVEASKLAHCPSSVSAPTATRAKVRL